MSPPLPLQHPSPPRPCIVLAFPTFRFVRIERPSSVHRRALAPHRTPPSSTPQPPSTPHLFRPRTDVSFSSIVRGGLEGFQLPPCQHRTTPTDQRPFVRSSDVSTWAASPQAFRSELPGKAFTTVADPRALSFIGQMAIGIPQLQTHHIMSKPLPLQQPRPVHAPLSSLVPQTGLRPASCPSLFYPPPRPRPSSVASLPSTDGRSLFVARPRWT